MNLSTRVQCNTGSVFKEFLNKLEFIVLLLMVRLSSQSHWTSIIFYSSNAGSRIVWCILFLKLLVLCEMQTALFRILNLEWCVHFFTTLAIAPRASPIILAVKSFL